MKTICIDLRALQIGHQNRGIGMHIRSILENLPESDSQYIFYCFDKNNPIEELGIKTKVSYKIVQTPTINTVLDSPKNILGIFRLVFHRFTPIKNRRIDTFIQFDFMLGLPRWRNIRKVMIGYDLIPIIMKNEYMPNIRQAWHHSIGKRAKLKSLLRSPYYRFRYKMHYRSYKRADRIVCISDYAAQSFEKFLKSPKQKIVSIPLAPVLPSRLADDSILLDVEKPYIFYIGGTDSRKNIQDIVSAFNIACGRGNKLSLVLAGNEFSEVNKIPDTAGRNAIIESPYRDSIYLKGFVTDTQKNALYQHAHAFIFASHSEGFGLPVVEAMSMSCPVIAYNNSSIPEAAGTSARLVSTGDFVAIAIEISLIFNATLRKDLVDSGKKQASKFTWEKYVKKFQEIL